MSQSLTIAAAQYRLDALSSMDAYTERLGRRVRDAAE